jgi:hypothetical protein
VLANCFYRVTRLGPLGTGGPLLSFLNLLLAPHPALEHLT